MGRAGGGSSSHSSSHSSSSGGGHSFGSSSGGHSYGSSSSSRSRAGGGSSYHSSSGSYGGGSDYRPYHHGGPPYMGGPFYLGGGAWQTIKSFVAIAVIIIVIRFIVLMCAVGIALIVGDGTAKSTIQRNKLTGVPAYSANCIVDELGYFENTGQAARGLKDFYDQTGVQPYIYIKDYDPSLTTDEQKEAYAKEYFDENIDQANGFLFVYFANEDEHDDSIPSYDKSIGYMCYAVGTSAKAVMDDEAVNIFWGYIDKYWTSDLSMEDMITTVFSDTANAIMHVSKTSDQIEGMIIIGVLVVAIAILITVVISIKRKAEAEKAKHTQEILDTPIENLNNAKDDDTVGKYL